MSVYKRGETWWFKFRVGGQLVRESSKSKSKTRAKEAERTRRNDVEDSYNNIRKRKLRPLFPVAAAHWLNKKTARIAPKTEMSYRLSIKHLSVIFGRQLITDIDDDAIAAYQSVRIKEGASPRTINIETSALRSILRNNSLWEEISKGFSFLSEPETPGFALSDTEESALLAAAGTSRSRGLPTVLILAINTGLRACEIHNLRWSNVDLLGRTLTVGKSKTSAGTGRLIPLNPRAHAALAHWRTYFPGAKPEHYVFPHEQYAQMRVNGETTVWRTDPTRPVGSWKVAWKNIQRRAGIKCRFHDLRHSAVTRLLEAEASFPLVAEIMGWSASTTYIMVKRYGHIQIDVKRRAMDAMRGADPSRDGAQKWAQPLQTRDAKVC